jgi:hypothetical protein
MPFGKKREFSGNASLPIFVHLFVTHGDTRIFDGAHPVKKAKNGPKSAHNLSMYIA